MTLRKDLLLAGLNKTDRIIEIGPLHSGLAKKKDGWNVTIVDYAPRAELVAKYEKNPAVHGNCIEEVDVIWRGGSLSSVFDEADHGIYRALIASHVIEHIPDLIGFFNSAANLLDPDKGVLALAVPDKRWCFDVFRPFSSTGQVLEAHRRRPLLHSADRRFDQVAYSVEADGKGAWGREPLGDLRFSGSLEAAKAGFEAWSDAPDAQYIDCHAWQFTPSSFELTILELGAMGFIDWQIDWLEPHPGAECICQLSRGCEPFPSTQARDARRLALMVATARELGELAERMPAEPVVGGA